MANLGGQSLRALMSSLLTLFMQTLAHIFTIDFTSIVIVFIFPASVCMSS